MSLDQICELYGVSETTARRKMAGYGFQDFIRGDGHHLHLYFKKDVKAAFKGYVKGKKA
jgi:hypothetical protein